LNKIYKVGAQSLSVALCLSCSLNIWNLGTLLMLPAIAIHAAEFKPGDRDSSCPVKLLHIPIMQLQEDYS
jgi:hypothetical protein